MTDVQQIKLKKCKYEFDYIVPLFEKKPKHSAFIAVVDGIEVGTIGIIHSDCFSESRIEDLDASPETVQKIIKEAMKKVFKD